MIEIIGYTYVLNPMSFEEEITAPINVKRTRNNKLQMAAELEFIIGYAEQSLNRVKQIPEKDNKDHADLVENLERLTKEALLAVEKATFYNGN